MHLTSVGNTFETVDNYDQNKNDSSMKRSNKSFLFIVVGILIIFSVAGYSFQQLNGKHSNALSIAFDENDDGGSDDILCPGDAIGEENTATSKEVADAHYDGLTPSPDGPEISDDDAKAAYQAEEEDNLDSDGQPLISADVDPYAMDDEELEDTANSIEPLKSDERMFPPDFCYRDSYRKGNHYWKDKYDVTTYDKDVYTLDEYSLDKYDKDIYEFDEFERASYDKKSYERNRLMEDCRSGWKDIGVGKSCYQNCAFGYSDSRFNCLKNCPSGYEESGIGNKNCKANTCKSGYEPYLANKCRAKCRQGYTDLMLTQCIAVSCKSGYSPKGINNCQENACAAGYENYLLNKCKATCKSGYTDYMANQCKADCKHGYENYLPTKCIASNCRSGYEEAGQQRCVEVCNDGYQSTGALGNRCHRKCPDDWVACGFGGNGLGCAQVKKTCVMMKLGVITATLAAVAKSSALIVSAGGATPGIIAANVAKGMKVTFKYIKRVKKFIGTAQFKKLKTLSKINEKRTILKDYVELAESSADLYKNGQKKKMFRELSKFLGFAVADMFDPTGLSAIASAVAYPKCYKSNYYWINMDKYVDE